MLVALLALAIVPVSAQRTAPPPSATRAPRPVPFAPGERLTYDVSWASTLTAGTATLSVAEKQPSGGSMAYYLVSEGRPTRFLASLYTLYYKVDSVVDASTLLPQRASVYSEEGRRHRLKSTVFEHARRRAVYQVETRTTVKQTVPIAADAQDPLSAMFRLRAIPLKAGDRITMPICDNGTSYKMLIEAGAAESIKTGVGVVQAQRLMLTPQGADVGARALTLWLTTDAAHVPAKMSAQLPVGSFVLTLASRR
jgi:hypothetical protein